MSSIYRRPVLAQAMASRILRPTALDEGLRSGLFLSGLRRTGKTTFLLSDLIPELQNAGAVVIYVDLWSDTQAGPASLVLAAVQETLEELQTPASGILKRLSQVRGVDVAALTFKFGIKLESLGAKGTPTLAEVIRDIVDQAKTDVVLIVDEVQHAISSDEGAKMLMALKAARDAVNPRPGTPGYFLFIGTGSHRALVSEMTTRRNEAFNGATSVAYPVLDNHYVAHLLARLAAEGISPLPSLPVATAAFETLGSRPEEMLRALRQLRHLGLQPNQTADEVLPVIASTLRSAAADIELRKIEDFGSLASAIFGRIASVEGGTRGVFTTEAAAGYGATIGRPVKVEEIQPVVNELLAANLVMRKAPGVYIVTDPFVQTMWQEKLRELGD